MAKDTAATSHHLHRSAVALPDGTPLTPVSFDLENPYIREERPDFGLYFDPCWDPPWEHTHLQWPDYALPTDPAAALSALAALLDRARRGQRVELGCVGGHGRTGTALACLTVLAGHPAADGVLWVRDNYCARAVETPEQERFVKRLRPTQGARPCAPGNSSSTSHRRVPTDR